MAIKNRQSGNIGNIELKAKNEDKQTENRKQKNYDQHRPNKKPMMNHLVREVIVTYKTFYGLTIWSSLEKVAERKKST